MAKGYPLGKIEEVLEGSTGANKVVEIMYMIRKEQKDHLCEYLLDCCVFTCTIHYRVYHCED